MLTPMVVGWLLVVLIKLTENIPLPVVLRSENRDVYIYIYIYK